MFRRTGFRLVSLIGALSALLTIAIGGGTASAAYPGLNGRIAFESQVDFFTDIYSVPGEFTGGPRTQNTKTTFFDNDPSYSPDGKRIIFENGGDILAVNADGSLGLFLIGSGFQPSYSFDGSKIAFGTSQKRVVPGGIWVMNANGSGRTQLTTSGDSPVFSPDGSKIVFTGFDGEDFEIYAMNANGSGQTALTNNIVDDRDPDFSPDGSKIVFTQTHGNINDEIFVMDANGSNHVQLTDNDLIDTNPVFSPNGLRIALERFECSNGCSDREILSMSSTGGDFRGVSFASETDDFDPTWQPIVDTDAPETTILSGPPDLSHETSPVFTFSSDESGSSFECKIDGGTFADCDSGDSFGPLGNGSHTFFVRAADSFGNVDSTPAQRTFEIRACTISGTNANNTISGTGNADVICGFGGIDKVTSLGGNDLVFAGTGNDVINTGAGSDRLLGEDGADSLTAATENDQLDGGAGSDKCNGGFGTGDTAVNCEVISGVP